MAAVNTTSLLAEAALCFALVMCPIVAHSEPFERVAPGPGMLTSENGELHARLNPSGCDVGFEAACSDYWSFQRSEFVFSDAHQHGDSVTYRWELMVPIDFAYEASGSPLRAARLYAKPEGAILGFQLDNVDGYHVSDKTCFSPEGFGKWHVVEVHAVWDSTKKKGLKDKTPGQIRVHCDGREILSRAGRPTIGAKEEVRLALGLLGSLSLSTGDNVRVSYRGFSVIEN